MKKFSDKSISKDFQLFPEIILAIGNLSDEEFDSGK